MAWRYLDLADFLLIAEAVLQTPAEDLARITRIDLAESALHAPAATFGSVEFYPDPREQDRGAVQPDHPQPPLARRQQATRLLVRPGVRRPQRWQMDPAC